MDSPRNSARWIFWLVPELISNSAHHSLDRFVRLLADMDRPGCRKPAEMRPHPGNQKERPLSEPAERPRRLPYLGPLWICTRTANELTFDPRPLPASVLRCPGLPHV